MASGMLVISKDGHSTTPMSTSLPSLTTLPAAVESYCVWHLVGLIRCALRFAATRGHH